MRPGALQARLYWPPDAGHLTPRAARAGAPRARSPPPSRLAPYLPSLKLLARAQLVPVSATFRPASARARPDPDQRAHPRLQGPPDRRGRRAGRRRRDRRGAGDRPRARPRPGRGRGRLAAARRPAARLLEVQVRAGAEGQGGPQAPAAGQRARDQAAAEDRRPRLRDEEGPRRALPRTGQGQGDDHVPRPRAGHPERGRALLERLSRTSARSPRSSRSRSRRAATCTCCSRPRAQAAARAREEAPGERPRGGVRRRARSGRLSAAHPPRVCFNSRPDAEDEDPFGRQEAVPQDRQGQAARPARLLEPHPREEVARSASGGFGRPVEIAEATEAGQACWREGSLMPRATNAVARKRRKKKVLKQAKGYSGASTPATASPTSS